MMNVRDWRCIRCTFHASCCLTETLPLQKDGNNAQRAQRSDISPSQHDKCGGKPSNKAEQLPFCIVAVVGVDYYHSLQVYVAGISADGGVS